MRWLAILLMAAAAAVHAGPIQQAPADPDQAAAIAPQRPIVSPLASRTDLKTLSVIKLRGLTALGPDYAATVLAQSLPSPEEGLGILRMQSSNPADFAVDRAFFAQIGLDPVNVARLWGKGDELTSLDHQPTTSETYIESTPIDMDAIKDELKEMKKSEKFRENFATGMGIKPYYPPFIPVPEEESVPWLQFLLGKIHDLSQEFIFFIIDNLYIAIAINVLTLFLVQLIMRRDR